jgi:hypothetical protein
LLLDHRAVKRSVPCLPIAQRGRGLFYGQSSTACSQAIPTSPTDIVNGDGGPWRIACPIWRADSVGFLGERRRFAAAMAVAERSAPFGDRIMVRT